MKKKANKTIGQLRRFESRNVTFIEPDGSWPIVWERAKGMRVWDDDGREYLDFTAAFAVAAAGHANPRIVAAGQRQMAKLLHAMGDVHPHALKAELARELSRLTFERLAKSTGKTIFCNSGFEAVEAALKTAHLATGRTRVIAFEDAYHGLGYGALNATWRSDFRSPFRRQIGGFASFVPFPRVRADLAKLEQRLATECRKHKVGAILVEPIQGRGGTNIPPAGFLKLLRKVCNQARRASDLRRGLHRLRSHRALVRERAFRRDAGYPMPRQSAHRRLPALGLRRQRGGDGSRLAEVHRRGDSHEHVPRPPGRLRDGARITPRT